MMEKINAKDKKLRKTRLYLLLLTSHLLLNKKGQVMLEFAFCMIVLFLMMYGIIMVFRWVGLDLGQRQQAHDAVLTAAVDPSYGGCVAWSQCCDPLDPSSCWNCNPCLDPRPVEAGPLGQVDPYFYTPAKMNAVWTGN